METESRSQPHPVYDFGEFRLDASRRLLFAKGARDPLPVAPKIIDALLLFIKNRGELLTKDQLMAGLWPGRIVEENNLSQLISVLRHALGEAPGENRYIATVPGYGYRFIADVSRVAPIAMAGLYSKRPSPIHSGCCHLISFSRAG